jgi:hypothetical protein
MKTGTVLILDISDIDIPDQVIPQLAEADFVFVENKDGSFDLVKSRDGI